MAEPYRRARPEVGCKATCFLQLPGERGGGGAARHPINADKPSDGYTRLYLERRLDLTVEAVVIGDRHWHPLLTEDELDRARRRLEANGYRAIPPRPR